MMLIIDLEATCSDDKYITEESMEIIEVGACWVTTEGAVLDTFQSFVRPIEHPCLTQFCMDLTGITQSQVDNAPMFPNVACALAAFCHSKHVAAQHWGSWGDFDRKQIERECLRHGVNNPLTPLQHINLKKIFAKSRRIKQVGMTTALKIQGQEPIGQHHRALDDALNIAYLTKDLGVHGEHPIQR